MDDQTPPEQMIHPTGETLTSQLKVRLRDTKPGHHHVWFIGGTVIIIGVAALVLLRVFMSPPTLPVTQVEVVTPMPSPTPLRKVSEIAIQGTFLNLEQAHASLSAQLSATNLDDPSLSPPVLDLPLGFRQ